MEKFFSEGDVSADELTAALPKAMAAGTVMPIFCTSAKKGIGIAELLDALAEDTLSPLHGKRRTAVKKGSDGEVELKPDPAADAVGQVFKNVWDKFVGNLSSIRLYSGTYKADQQLINARTERGARSGGLMAMQGSKSTPVTEAIAGDIVAVSKLEDLHTGDT